MPDPVLKSSAARRLPDDPNLEQLRKQARELLDRYRAGERTAVAEVERIERIPHPAAFALHDAQRVLARAYGFQSWSKLKAFVDGANIAKFAEAVKAGDLAQARLLLRARPELIAMDMSGSDEHRALHFAVMRRDLPMVRLLMEAGADARKGIFPHRDATSAFAIARDRDYSDVLILIQEEELERRKEMSCPNATVSPVQDRIHAAIAQGSNAEAMRLLEADKSLIQACDRSGGTPLHIAAEDENLEMLDWLLARRANVHKEDMAGRTALDRAAFAADPRNAAGELFPSVAARLLANGASFTLPAAVALGDPEAVRHAIALNSTALRHIDQNGGLVTLAVKHGQAEIIRILLDAGADVDERTTLAELEEPTVTWGMPLWFAALAGNAEIAKLLLERGADPNANVYASGWPLRNAWHHEPVKRLLLAAGAKVQPYMVSEEHDAAEARTLLADHPDEAVVNELAWSAADHGCPAILELALPHLPWAVDDERWHWLLMQPIRGASNDPGQNEEFFACMALLLRHGVNPNVARKGQTTLHYAAGRHGPVGEEDRARFAAMLLDAGALFDLRDNILQSTALGWACRWGRKTMAELLIARGAPVNEPEAEPWATPLAWAEKGKHSDIIQLLLFHGAKKVLES